ncbi:hypothetical protein [Pseudomonas sp. LB1P83]
MVLIFVSSDYRCLATPIDILFMHTVFFDQEESMNTEHLATSGVRTSAIAQWELLLRDEAALLENPGRHHKALLTQAHALHRNQVINRDDLSDLLEQADGALAYAVEALIDCRSEDQAG